MIGLPMSDWKDAWLGVLIAEDMRLADLACRSLVTDQIGSMICTTADVTDGIKMKEFKFRDYNVRVWSGDVFIDSINVFQYSGGRSGEGAQTLTKDKQLNDKIIDVCRNIADEFLKLDALIDETISSEQ